MKLLGVFNDLHMDQLHFQLSSAGLVSLLVPQAGLASPGCPRQVLYRSVASEWKINAGRQGVQRGWELHA